MVRAFIAGHPDFGGTHVFLAAYDYDLVGKTRAMARETAAAGGADRAGPGAVVAERIACGTRL